MVTQGLALRRGRMTEMVNHGTGWVRLEFRVPARGLIGFRSAAAHRDQGDGHPPPPVRRLRRRGPGDLRTASTAAPWSPTGPGPPRLRPWQPPGAGRAVRRPGEPVYEGMVIGENARPEDMDVNPTREKQKTNIRTHAADEAIKLVPPAMITLEKAIEFIGRRRAGRGHPAPLRLRKRVLDAPSGGGRPSGPARVAERRGMEIRAGVHTGEVQLRGDDVGGIAVHFAAVRGPRLTRPRPRLPWAHGRDHRRGQPPRRPPERGRCCRPRPRSS